MGEHRSGREAHTHTRTADLRMLVKWLVVMYYDRWEAKTRERKFARFSKCRDSAPGSLPLSHTQPVVAFC